MISTGPTSLKSYNTFGVDAHCAAFFVIDHQDLILSFLDTSIAQPYILGGGSNLLIVNDLPYTILKNEIKGTEVIEENEAYINVCVGGGVVWHDFVLWAIENGYGGVENLSLIPGCVGAAPIQNIGAYGIEQESSFLSLDAIELESGNHLVFEHKDCQFGYRDSIFKRDLKGKLMITHVTYRLSKSPEVNTSYGAITETLAQKGINHPSIRDVSNAVIEIRSSKLPDPKVLGNSGSFFKNPVVNASFFDALMTRFDKIVHYKLPDGTYKIPAGWLIDQCGWRGKREGNVGCYEKQALVIVNHGGATGIEIWNFAQKIQADVLDKYGIELEPEVNVLI
jgi:UDP-N-acetylmuramate dehydrogenase